MKGKEKSLPSALLICFLAMTALVFFSCTTDTLTGTAGSVDSDGDGDVDYSIANLMTVIQGGTISDRALTADEVSMLYGSY